MLPTTSLRTEIIAGLTTFFTMAYIVVVNPMILSQTGMDYQAVFVATCLSAALGCFAMGFLANYPLALAPSMSLNAYFTFYVVQQLHLPWQIALGIVFIAGVLFALLTFTQFRQWMIYSMPTSLQTAIAAGIGLFLIRIGFKNLGGGTEIFLCLLGVGLILLFERLRFIGAILLAMIAITLIGFSLGLTHWHGIFALPGSLVPTFMQLQMPSLFDLQSLIVIVIFLFVTLFDNTGTLVAVLHQAHLLPLDKRDARAKSLGRALFADSLAATAGAVLGTSSTGSYVESAAGVRAGGRTGLTAFVVGILFLFALFFSPLAKTIPAYAAAIALIYVGYLMTKNISRLPWRNYAESIPGLLCAILIPVTFSIADGVSAGFISFILLKYFSGKKSELNMGLWVAGGLSLFYVVIRMLTSP